MPKYIVTSPSGQKFQITAPDGATEDDIFSYVQGQLGGEPERPDMYDYLGPPDRSLGGAATSGFGRAAEQLKVIGGDLLPALGLSLTGKPRLAEEQLKEAAAAQEQIAREYPAEVPRVSDVTLRNFPTFAAETIGETAASAMVPMGTGFAASIAGRQLAKRAAQRQIDETIAKRIAASQAAGPTSEKIIRETAQPAVARILSRQGAKGAELGSLAGTYVGGTGLVAPDIFQNIYENSGDLAPGVALLGGGLAGALESVLPYQLSKAFKASPKSFQAEVIKKIGERKGLNSFTADLAGKTVAGVGKAAVTEGLTEGTQEAISIAAEKFVDGTLGLWGSEDFDRIWEATAKGAVGGGGLGAIPGVSDTLRTRAIEAEEFARRAPPPPPETPVGTPDEGIAPPVDAGPLAERSALSGEPLAVPAGAGVGLGPEEIKVGLNRQVAPEVRDVEWEPEDSLSMLADEQRRIDEEEQRQRIEAEQTAIEDIAKETPEFESDQTPVEAPKVITSEELSKFGFSKDSLVMKTLSGMPYATPEQVEEIRSIVSEKIKNPNQRQKSEEFLKSLGAPESKVSPPIPLALSKEELIPAIEQDKNAYAAIERLAGRKAALDQLAGDQYVGAKGLLQEEVLPFSGPEQQKQYQDYVSPEDRRYVQNRITGLKAAEKRQEYRTKQEVEQAQLQEMPQEIEEALGEEGAFEQIAVPEITQIPEYRKKLSSGLAKYVKSGRKKPPPWQKEYSELKKYLELEGNSELEGTSKSKDGPMLEELRFMETPAAEQGVSSPEAFKQEVKKFLGREPETEDIRVTTTPSAAKMKGVPKRAVAQAELGGKKATFFTKRIPSGKEISVFMHEVGTHVGMKNLVGETNYKYLIDKVNEWAADPKKELKNEIARAALARIPESTPDASKGDEAIAYFVSEAVERGVSPKAIAKVNSPLGLFFKYIMQGIKDVLTKLGLPGYEPTTQDIIDIAYGAAQLTYDRAAKAQKKAARAEEKAVKETPAPVYMEAAPTKKPLETDEEAAAVLTRPAQYVSMRNSGARKLLERADEIINSFNPTVRPSLSFVERVIEGLSRVALKIYVRLLSITQLAEIVKRRSPALSAALNKIHEIAANRDVNVSDQKQRIQDFINTARKTVAKYSPEIADKLYTFMHESSIAEVKFDFDKRLKEATAAHQTALKNVPKDVGNQIKDAQAKKDTQREQQLRSLVDARDRAYLNLRELIADHKRVQDDPKLRKLFDDFEKFEQKYPDLGKLYYDLRDEYKKLADSWSDVLNQPELLGPAGKIINDLIKKRIDPYFPLYRRGDFWVRYVDKDGTEGVSAFETGQEAREFVRFLKTEGVQDKDIIEYIKPTEAQMESMMPLGQMQEVIKILKQKSASPEVLEGIYDIYLDMFSNQSVMQAFKKRKGLQGYRNDALANFADVGTRMAINIEQFKTVRRLDEVLREAKTLANKELSPSMGEAVESMLNASEPFLKNPVQKTMFGRFASAASHNAYRWYILGNISSALINTSQIPMVVVPLLGGKFGLTEAISAVKDATKMYWAGGYDDNTTMLSPFTGRNLSDRSFAGKKAKLSEEYQRLYQNAVQRGAIRRSVGQDLMAMRNLGVADPEDKAAYKMMQVEQSMGWAFQNAERFNREVTLLAAYKLAKKDGMSEAEATDYALNLVEFSHGSAMSELGPQLLQSGFGKLLGVFKRFAFNQIYLQAKLFYDAFRGADAKTKAVARRQLLGIYATTFAFAGLKGVPAYGLINVLASMIFGDDDEPFNLDDALLRTFGPIGFSGPFGYYTNIGVAGRLGFGDLLWRPDDKRLAELGPLMYTIENLAGPVYGVIDNLRKGMEQMAEGNVMKGLETATPSALKNFFRTYRFATEGVLNSKGYKIIEDPNFADLVMSATGFTPNDHNIAYEQLSIVKDFERKALERRAQLLDRRAAAIRVGDYDGLRDIDKQIFDFNKSKFGRGYRIEDATKRKSLEQRKIQEQRAIQAGTFGSNVNPRLLKEAKEAAGLE